MNYVTIKGQRYNLYQKLQDYVKCTMQKLIETNSISIRELNNLQDKDYCKETFNLKYPLLSKDRNAYLKDKNHFRYYAKKTFCINGYYLCNDWYESRNANKFSKWMESLADK